MEQQGLYKTALYCRLSQDDGVQGDSSSIQTQKAMLEYYAKERGYIIHDFYVDDGFSGTNFNRPSFQKLLKDIDNGIVNLVITKDLSRLGRDYIMTGYYTEIYFSDRSVRYIAINDNIDTLKNDNDIAPFKNILNDMYIRDISRKIKTARRQRSLQGLFQGSGAPYGYIKDPNNKNKLLINPETATVVRRIFDLRLSGYGSVYIARQLTKDKILTPAAMKAILGDTRFQRYFDDNNAHMWNDGTINIILDNPIYTGDMVNLKVQVANYKTRKIVANTKDKMIFVPDTHTAIVTREEFERVKTLKEERHAVKKRHEIDNLFKGLIRCSVCGARMALTSRIRRGKLVSYYRCGTFVNLRLGEEGKHWTTIKYEEIKEIVTERLKEFFKLFKDDDKLIQIVQKKIEDNNISVDCEKELAKIESRQKTLANITKKVYDDYFEGKISESTYQDLIKRYENEQAELKEKHSKFLAEKIKKKDYLEDFQKLKQLVNSFTDFEELTQEMVFNLIDSIEISNEGPFKCRKQRTIKITYRFLELAL